ncbi:hypothetical protein KUTeg_004255 [Tegillarca granosa]|uniref:Post-GPI attachment to proteins factor 1 n=1 Tax=Tegillarca granosa TaxID=220873 RepID=A0ABQ9FPG9_TEGGR|nr:hypothetical protein KUTeg_004255 [Tegillarca granosa]
MTVLRATLSVLCIGVIVYGILDVLTNVENNKCYMTYMFQMPEYIRVPLGKKISKEFPRYGLYLYGEGQYADQIKNFKLSGIPVLFIPGNAGSYKQVRSLGSVALRKSEDERKPFHFNYFSVDLNEGGMIARALFTLPDFDQQLVNTIITQATPHQGPVIALDRHMSQFYDNVNGYWRKHSNTALKHVTVISTGGGYRDKLVRHAFTSLKGIVDPELSVSTSTMSVPNAWVSTDHLCAVWCKQMVMTTKRAMFDIIDPNTHQVIEDTGYRMAVFRHHFLSHSGPKQYDNSWTEEIVLDPKVEWSVKEEKLWEFARSKVIHLKLQEIKDMTHIVLIVPKTDLKIYMKE